MKEVEITIEIDKAGKLHVEPVGTEGEECLTLLAFLDKIPGFRVTKTEHNDDMKKKKAQRVINKTNRA